MLLALAAIWIVLTPESLEPTLPNPSRIQLHGAIIVCDQPTHDFGIRWVGPDLNHEFELHNDGMEPAWVRISHAGGPTGGCMAPIEAGETIYLPVSMRSDKVRGKFEKGISVRMLPASGGQSETPWCIRRPFENACEAPVWKPS